MTCDHDRPGRARGCDAVTDFSPTEKANECHREADARHARFLRKTQGEPLDDKDRAAVDKFRELARWYEGVDLPREPQKYVSAIRRELRMRARLYPVWSPTGRMTAQQAEQIAVLEEVLADLRDEVARRDNDLFGGES